MFNTKFNLYKNEWLDLVFDDRNKAYGAYYLRNHSSSITVRAMLITFSAVALLCGATVIFKNNNHPDETRVIDVAPMINPVLPPLKKEEPKLPEHTKAQVDPPKTTTVKFTVPKPTSDPVTANPPTVDDLKGKNVGTENIKGTDGLPSVDLKEDPKTGPGDGKTDESIHTPFGLESMPEPIGGMSAFSKFLSKNLRFPAEAQADGVSGRVFVSFVIEKDGHLSNITVERPAGHGFDEEALRVLKLAKAWKPGIQNGQPVRVKYSIPINFQANTD